MKVHRLALLAAAGAAVVSLSGCAQVGGVAAKVGDDTVSADDVEFLTRMQCETLASAADDPASASQVQTVPRSRVRTEMVNVLVQSELNAQLAETGDGSYDTASYRQVMDQFEGAVELVGAEDRDRFRDLVGAYYRGQLQAFKLAQIALVGQGVATPTDQQLQDTIAGMQDGFRSSVDVEIDPVYGPGADGLAGEEDPSISAAVSEYAEQAVEPEPTASWTGALPSKMRCG